MSCKCCNGKVTLTFQQGNNVMLEFTHLDDDVVCNFEQGYDLICGIYISSDIAILQMIACCTSSLSIRMPRSLIR